MTPVEPIPDDVSPLMRAVAGLSPGGALRFRSGSLFLFPDRITFASARGAVVWLGAVGLLISRARSLKRARRGGFGVVEIPFTDIAAVRSGRLGLRADMVEVDTRSGEHYRLAVKFARWGEPIRDAITSRGLNVTDEAQGFRVD